MSLNKLLTKHLDCELKTNSCNRLDARTAWKTFSSIYRLAEKSERFPGDVKLMFMALSPRWAKWAKLMDADENMTSMASAPKAIRAAQLQRLRRKAEKRKREQQAWHWQGLTNLCRAFGGRN